MSADKTIAKYLNSPESEIYHKSRVLYGIYQAKRSIIKEDKCYLVEGYTDVTSFHQSGIENVVASSGTSLTIEQIRLIRRFTNNVTIIYDGDQAGIKASLRGIDMVLEEGINVKVVPLPDGEDPDTFARSMGAFQLETYIKENETDFIKFKTQLLLSGAKNDPLSRAGLITDIVSSISKISNDILRTEYLKECSKLLDVSEELLYNEIRKLKIKAGNDLLRVQERELVKEQYEKKEIPIQSPLIANPCEIEEREVLRLLLKYGPQPLYELEEPDLEGSKAVRVDEFILSELNADNMESSDPCIKQIIDEYNERLDEENFDSARYFINHPNPGISHLATDLLAEKNKLSSFWKKRGNFIEEEHEILDQLVPRILQEYKLRFITNMISRTKEDIQKAAMVENYELIAELQTKYQKLKSVEAVLCDKLNKRIIRF
jgi:DNA primase